jgi:hypothetical protein
MCWLPQAAESAAVACACMSRLRAGSLTRWRPQAAESAAADKTYGGLEQVPGTVAERQSVDEERFSSAALYGLAGSPAGAAALLGERGAAVQGARGGGRRRRGGAWRVFAACGRPRAGRGRAVRAGPHVCRGGSLWGTLPRSAAFSTSARLYRLQCCARAGGSAATQRARRRPA